MKEIIWIQDLLSELQLKDKQRIPILYQDNQGAIFLQKNNSNKQRTKHIDVRYHFIREGIQAQRAEVRYCPTETMIADILTKALQTPAFRRHRDIILSENETITSTNEDEESATSKDLNCAPCRKPVEDCNQSGTQRRGMLDEASRYRVGATTSKLGE
jgi:hypothetical protein